MADLDVNIRAIDQTQRGIRQADRNFGTLDRSIKNVGFSALTTTAGILGIGLTAASLFQFAKVVAGTVVDMKQLSAETGVAFDFIDRLTGLSKEFGGGLDEVAGIVGHVQSNLHQLSVGGGQEFARNLALIGLSARDFIGLKPEDAIERIAVALGEEADQTRKLSLARALLGPGVGPLVRTLQPGPEPFTGLEGVTPTDPGFAVDAEETDRFFRRLGEDAGRAFTTAAADVIGAGIFEDPGDAIRTFFGDLTPDRIQERLTEFFDVDLSGLYDTEGKRPFVDIDLPSAEDIVDRLGDLAEGAGGLLTDAITIPFTLTGAPRAINIDTIGVDNLALELELLVDPVTTYANFRAAWEAEQEANPPTVKFVNDPANNLFNVPDWPAELEGIEVPVIFTPSQAASFVDDTQGTGATGLPIDGEGGFAGEAEPTGTTVINYNFSVGNLLTSDRQLRRTAAGAADDASRRPTGVLT
ncbi:MAG: hypothetical protein OXE50_02165 [Chloroflexi bacterium]|nr:hypothetical protein [Chloroflexota bacterium]